MVKKNAHTPRCECTTSATLSTPSRTGYAVPPTTKAAPVMGIKDALRRRSNAQWWDPWLRDGAGYGVGSLTVPLRMATKQDSNIIRKRIRSRHTSTGNIGRCGGRCTQPRWIPDVNTAHCQTVLDKILRWRLERIVRGNGRRNAGERARTAAMVGLVLRGMMRTGLYSGVAGWHNNSMIFLSRLLCDIAMKLWHNIESNF